MNKLTDIIRQIIALKGLKNKAVAERLNLSEKQFSDMLTGRKKIYGTDIYDLCSALDVTPNELFGYSKSA